MSAATTDAGEALHEQPDVDAIREELREVGEQLRRAVRRLAAIEAMDGIDAAAIAAATTHVRLYCGPSGYAIEEADEPPPALGESVETGRQAFVVDRFTPSPLPSDPRRCAVLVASTAGPDGLEPASAAAPLSL